MWKFRHARKGGQWDETLSVFKELQDIGVKFNVMMFEEAISACEKGGPWG